MTVVIEPPLEGGVATAVGPAAVPAPARPRRGAKRTPRIATALAFGWIALVLVSAILADVLPIPRYDEIIARPNLPPGPDALLGTDSLGRDTLSRLIFGARVSLYVGIVGTTIGMLIGSVIGLVAGYFRGLFENIADLGIAAMLAFPPLIVLLAVVAMVRADVNVMSITLGVLVAPAFARIVKTNTLALREREYVVAARALGARPLRVLATEVLPNTLVSMFSLFAVTVAVLIAAEGGLSFLGVGVAPPTPSWGGMINAGRERMEANAWPVLLPCLTVFLTIYSFNILGDFIQRRLAIGDSKL